MYAVQCLSGCPAGLACALLGFGLRVVVLMEEAATVRALSPIKRAHPWPRCRAWLLLHPSVRGARVSMGHDSLRRRGLKRLAAPSGPIEKIDQRHELRQLLERIMAPGTGRAAALAPISAA
jgi:hypothetical protein